MQFAIIGEAEDAAFVAEAIDRSTEHDLGQCCVSGVLAETMAARGLAFTLVKSPEEAMTARSTDVVVVAVPDVDLSIAICRQASQADRHVIVLPPDSVSTAFSYELHLLLDESQAGIVPLTGRWYLNPQQDASAVFVPDTDASIRRITMTAGLSDDPDELSRMQLHGIDAVSGCGFQFTQITCMDVPGADGKTLSRNITLASAESSEVKAPPATLTFNADSPELVDVDIVRIHSEGNQSEIRSALPRPGRSEIAVSSAPMLEALVSRLGDSDACQRGMEQFSNTLELMAGLAKSLRRRRTVDVYFDGVSERGAFKTNMAAIGCGVLSYVIFGMIGFLVIAQVADLPPGVLKFGRALWVAPVVLYLLAQLLLPLARQRGGTDHEAKKTE